MGMSNSKMSDLLTDQSGPEMDQHVPHLVRQAATHNGVEIPYIVIPESSLVELGKELHAIIRKLTVLRKHGKPPGEMLQSLADDAVDLTVQSEDQSPDISGETGETTTQVTTTFDDTKGAAIIDQSVVPILYQPSGSVESDIAKFMSRPVKIHNFNWTLGASIDSSIFPWHLYFNNSAINRKLENYAFLRCDLHIKILINASPFYYGALLISYNPLQGSLDSARIEVTANQLVPKSQRPHVWIYPQTNEGAEMVLPYFNTTEWLATASATDFQDMGLLDFTSGSVLQTANAIAGTSVDVAIYAWAENVQLCGLTVEAAVQSQDEYCGSKGPISKPASAVARATGALSNVPGIGPYMTATSIAANSVANIAALFGYSKVPVIDNVTAFKNLPFHGLASSDISEPTDKLSLDSKNELTVNNSCIGDVNTDPLNIANFCSRSSYLTSFDWTATDSVSQLLWNCYVNPLMSATSSFVNQTVIAPTPMWVAANCFYYWRGDIIFDIKVICSQYHRGRLRLSWDPVGDISATTNSSELVYTQIVDITETTNFSVRIPYTQRAAYLKVPTGLSSTIFSTAPLLPDTSDTVNGILTIRVQNEQTSPVASAPIDVFVSVRGAENLEFASPKDIENDIYFYTVQSQDELVVGTTQVNLGGSSSVDPNINLVYMGEKIVSLRSLLMRCNHTRSDYVFASASAVKEHVTTQSRRPLYKGYDTNGIHSATGLSSTTPEGYNFVSTTPYHLISPCFLGERGSFTWKFDIQNNNIQSMNINRQKQLLNSANYAWSGTTITVSNADGYANHFMNAYKTPSGAMMQNSRTNTGFSVNAPMYEQHTMLDTAPITRTEGKTGISSNDSIQCQFLAPTTAGSAIISTWFQVGPDYSPFFFLNVPTVFKYSSDPVYTP